jgi:hypothetical protein
MTMRTARSLSILSVFAMALLSLSPAATATLPGTPLDFTATIISPANSFDVVRLEWKLNPNGGTPTWFLIYKAAGNQTDPNLFSKITKVAPVTHDSGLTWQSDYSYDVTSLQSGEYSFYIVAYNNDGYSPRTTIQVVTVRGSGHSGIAFTTTPPKFAYVGVEYAYDADATLNGSGANVLYAGMGLPQGATIDSITGMFRFTPTASGVIGFSIKAYSALDPALAAIQQINVKVLQDSNSTNPTACALITGRVVDSAQNTVSGKVIAYAADSIRANVGFVAHIVNGAFSLPVPAGTYVLYFTGTGFTSEFYQDAATIQQATRITVACHDTIAITAYVDHPAVKSISGAVTDSANTALMAKIKVYTAANSVYYSTATLNDGTYSISVPANTDYVVAAYPTDPAYAAQYYDHAVDYGHATHIFLDADRTGIDFTLTRNHPFNTMLAGIVTDSTGAPVQATVTAFAMTSTNQPDPTHSVSTATDSSGFFSLQNIGYGAYYLFVQPLDQDYIPGYYNQHTGHLTQDWHDATLIKFPSNASLTVRIAVDKRHGIRGGAVLHGIISGSMAGFAPGDQPIGGALLVLRDPQGNISDYAISDNLGRYELDECGLGTFTLSVDKIGYSLYSTPVALNFTDKSDVSISVVLQPQTATGVDRPTADAITLHVYPNPASTTLLVFSQLLSEGVALRIVNTAGQTVYSSTGAAHSSLAVDISSLRPGAYFLHVAGMHSQRTASFTIVR